MSGFFDYLRMAMGWWSAPPAAASVTGGCWAQGSLYSVGFQEGDTSSPAFENADVFQPGFKAGQEVCE